MGTRPDPDGGPDEEQDPTLQLVRPCDWCDEPGEWICVHCNLALCKDCMVEHKRDHPRVDER